MTHQIPALALVIPTYRETESLRGLLFELSATKPPINHIVIVDDSEKGQSSKIALEFATALNNDGIKLHVISNYVKSGRGAAVRQGFTYLLDNFEVDYFIEMDADGSHNPKEISNLCSALKNGSFVIASRYISGGQIIGWSARRKIMSRFVNVLIQKLFKLNLKDCTNGFRAYKKESIEVLVEHNSLVNDFLYLSEQILVLRKRGIEAVEVPSLFINRTHGSSTVNSKVLITAVLSLIRLKALLYSRLR